MSASPRDNPHIEIVARALIVRGGWVLLCRNRKAGHAFLPGGHVEFAESAQVALAREMNEEAGVDLRVGGCVLVGEASFVQNGRCRHEINLVFHGELPPDRATPAAGTKPDDIPSLEPHIAFEWFPVEHLGHSHANFKPAWMIEHIRQRLAGQTRADAPNSRAPHPVWVSFMESPLGHEERPSSPR